MLHVDIMRGRLLVEAVLPTPEPYYPGTVWSVLVVHETVKDVPVGTCLLTQRDPGHSVSPQRRVISGTEVLGILT